jgi:hypothetical protein
VDEEFGEGAKGLLKAMLPALKQKARLSCLVQRGAILESAMLAW